jgi:hypothetical protein
MTLVYDKSELTNCDIFLTIYTFNPISLAKCGLFIPVNQGFIKHNHGRRVPMAETLVQNRNILQKGMVIALSTAALAGTVEQTAFADTSPPPQAEVQHHPTLVYHVPKPIKLPPLLKIIGSCESAGSRHAKIRWRAQNPTTSASGGFQIMDGTWNGFRGYIHAKNAPPRIQKIKAKGLFKKHGTSPWLSSISCWG